MKTKTGQLLAFMKILSWVVLIGLMIRSGMMVFLFILSIWNPGATDGLYEGMDLTLLREYNFGYYSSKITLMIAVECTKTFTAYLVMKVLSDIKMSSPFTEETASTLQSISYLIFGTWMLAMLHNMQEKWLVKRIDGLDMQLLPTDFILIAFVVLIFSLIFKRGVELQSENELTV